MNPAREMKDWRNDGRIKIRNYRRFGCNSDPFLIQFFKKAFNIFKMQNASPSNAKHPLNIGEKSNRQQNNHTEKDPVNRKGGKPHFHHQTDESHHRQQAKNRSE